MLQRVPFEGEFLCRITDGKTSVDIVPWGGSIRSIRVPDRTGKLVDVCLGYDTPGEYQTMGGALGALVGPYANRISGAAFTLNGQTFHLFANEGANTLHSGKVGFHHKKWELSEAGENSLLCVIEANHGEGGFPGNRRVEVTYTWQDGALTIDYRAVSDADTVFNLTNHAYFNLAGAGEGTVEDHLISIAADAFTPAGGDNVPTGELRDVAGTPWDLRKPTRLGDVLGAPELESTKGFDQNFVLNRERTGPVARVTCPRTGITMTMETDMEGVQLYSAGTMSQRTGKEGRTYLPTGGLCLETQHFPDAVNKPAFPSPVVRAGETFRSRTVYRFTAE